MNFKELFGLINEEDFKLEYPRSDQWYKTFDAFFPDANKREELPPKYEEYDNWTDYLDFESGDIEENQLPSFIEYFDLQSIHYLNDNYLNLRDSQSSYWFQKNDDLYEKQAESDEDMKSDIHRIDDHIKLELMGLTEDNLYIGGWECTIGEFRSEGGLAYHYTTEEKWEKIQKTRELRTSYGTGLTNRNANGIFASVSPDTYAEGTYGDILLEIDLTRFKNDYNIERLDLSPEPDVLEAAINNSFANSLGFDDYDEYISSDMSEETVIIGYVIPLKYIKQL